MIIGMPRIAVAVHNFEAILSMMRDKLGLPVVDISEQSVALVGTAVAMCVPEGGSFIELMAPANPEAPVSQSLTRFLDRHGEGPFAMLLEAHDPELAAEELSKRGLAVLPLMEGSGGRDVHPKSTHGVLIRVYPSNSFKLPDDFQPPSADAAGLSGIARVLNAVEDFEQAVAVYATKLGLAMDEPTVCEHTGLRSAICRAPTGGMIELVAVENSAQPPANSVREFLDTRGEGMYALVLKSQNLLKTHKSLESRGVAVRRAPGLPDVLEIERSSAFGALIRIEAASVGKA